MTRHRSPPRTQCGCPVYTDQILILLNVNHALESKKIQRRTLLLHQGIIHIASSDATLATLLANVQQTQPLSHATPLFLIFRAFACHAPTRLGSRIHALTPTLRATSTTTLSPLLHGKRRQSFHWGRYWCQEIQTQAISSTQILAAAARRCSSGFSVHNFFSGDGFLGFKLCFYRLLI